MEGQLMPFWKALTRDWLVAAYAEKPRSRQGGEGLPTNYAYDASQTTNCA